MEYNSGRPKMIIPEYGRHIQKMVDYATGIEDQEERNRCARAIITVMGQLNPHLRDVADFKHKLWDHLFIMSNFTLEVDSPYEKPDPSVLEEKPELLSYPAANYKYRHYGKIIEDLILKATEFEEGDKKKALTASIANLMKRTYLIWNSDSVNDDVISKDLNEMSGGKLSVPKDFEYAQTNELVTRKFTKKRKRPQGSNRPNHRNRRRK